MSRIIKDSGWSRDLKNLQKGGEVTVGIHESDANRGDGPTNALIGFWQEFGTHKNGRRHIPPRSFLQSTASNNEREHRKVLNYAIKKSLGGYLTLKQAFAILGLKVSSDIKETIRAQIPPPLADSTIRKKKSSTPLIDTGQLINSIDYEVSKNVV